MRLVILACTALALAATSRGAHAQAADADFSERGPRFLLTNGSTPVRVDAARVPILLRRIALRLDGVELHDALSEVSRLSGLKLMYSDQVLPGGRVVTVRADAISVAGALTEILLDAEVDVLFSSSGNAALIKRDRPQQAATGIVAGRVTDSLTAEGVAQATVSVEGTRLSTTTSGDGRYTIAGVPAGERTLTVRRLGYMRQSQRISVPESGSAVLDFSIARVPTMLTEAVATATGERQRLEVGNSIGTIRADSIVETTLIRHVSDLLTARTPGVIVSSTNGAVGAPTKIRVRGVNSIQLNNDPIIIVDGVRVYSQVTSPAGRSTPATVAGADFRMLIPGRIDALDPNTIESIDILRGPSASSLYGTEAANGVIVIRTKQGRAGGWRTNLMVDNGWSMPVRQPLLYSVWATGLGTNGEILNSTAFWDAGNWCTIVATPIQSQSGNSMTGGGCRIDSVKVSDVLNHPDHRLVDIGTARTMNASLSGGNDQVTQYLSVSGVDRVGNDRMSRAEQRRLTRMRGNPPPRWLVRPNTQSAINAASRTALRLRPELDMNFTFNGSYDDLQGGARGNPIFQLDDTLRNLPAEFARTRHTTLAKRGTMAWTTHYMPWTWLGFHSTVGGDYTLRTDEMLERAQDCTFVLNPNGCRSAHVNGRQEQLVTSASVRAELSFRPASWLSSRTSLGQQYYRTRVSGLAAGNPFQTNLAFGSELLTPPPVPTSPGAQLFAVTQNRDESATAGLYLSQTAGVRERLFLTAALRRDAASAFGQSVNAGSLPIYPKFDASWVFSDEPFFPFRSWVPAARLRVAYGHSGNQGIPSDVLRGYQAVETFVGGVTRPGINLNTLGNPDLKPERTKEIEGGVDLSFLDGERLQLRVTRYRKRSEDAIMAFVLPPSYGLNSPTIRANIGSVENRGTEAEVTARLLDFRRLSWDFSVNYTQNSNKLVKKSDATGASLAGGFLVEGYPLFGIWDSKIISYHDANGDGLLGLDEVTFATGAEFPGIPPLSVYHGAPYPKSEVTYSSNWQVLGGLVHVNALFDQRNGQITSATVRTSNGSYAYARCTVDVTCSLAQQAATIEAITGTMGYLQELSWIRFAEFSVTGNLPQSFAQRLRSRSVSLTFAARNLGLWTNYVGADPDATSNRNTITDGLTVDDGSINPAPRNYVFRINLGL